MMDGNLYQSPELSTSSLPLSALMSADHGDPGAGGHCALTHSAHAHTHTILLIPTSRRHLGNNQGISELRREGNQWGANMLYEKFLPVMASVQKVGGRERGEGGCGSGEVKM